MIYKGAFALSLLLAANISAMEEDHCCPKGEATCRCHHHHHDHDHDHDHLHEPATFASTPTTALPNKASPDMENGATAFVPEALTGASFASDSSMAKTGVDRDTALILPVSTTDVDPTDVAHAVMNQDNETTSEISTKASPVERDIVQAEAPSISIPAGAAPVVPTEWVEGEKERFKAISLERSSIQEYAPFLRSKGKKIAGARDIKGENKEVEVKDNDLPPPELDKINYDESSQLESWLEHLLGIKIAKTNLVSLLKTI
jgi:hypothetical protein